MYGHSQHLCQKRKEGEALIKILLAAANDAETATTGLCDRLEMLYSELRSFVVAEQTAMLSHAKREGSRAVDAARLAMAQTRAASARLSKRERRARALLAHEDPLAFLLAVEKEYGSLNPVLWEISEEKKDRAMKTKEMGDRGGSTTSQDTGRSLVPPRLDETRARELERFGELRVAIFSSLTPPCSRDSSPPLMDYACSPVFNKDTAHPQLQLSDDMREVTCTKRRHPYPESPQRFDHWEQVDDVFFFLQQSIPLSCIHPGSLFLQ
uniref:SPRY-associated domain-containing protein n=1 Tax=Eptatretus burgeri TaxID=7764 RepID=A0A8C4NFE3_EPTBU